MVPLALALMCRCIDLAVIERQWPIRIQPVGHCHLAKGAPAGELYFGFGSGSSNMTGARRAGSFEVVVSAEGPLECELPFDERPWFPSR